MALRGDINSAQVEAANEVHLSADLYSTDCIRLFSGSSVSILTPQPFSGSNWIRVDLIVPHLVTGIVARMASYGKLYRITEATIQYKPIGHTTFTTIADSGVPKVKIVNSTQSPESHALATHS